MPLVAPVLSSLILTQMASHGIMGQSSPQLATALGTGIVNSILTTGIYTGASNGLGLGVGMSTGTITGAAIIGSSVTGLLMTNATAFGLVGQSVFQLMDSVGQAFAAHMSTALVIGTSTVVAIGSGTGIITGIVAPVMSAAIYAQMLVMGLAGSMSTQLASTVGTAISTAISTSIVNTTITGVAIGPIPPIFAPIPSVGTDVGKII